MTTRRAGLAGLWLLVMAAELGAIALMASFDAPDNLMMDLLVAAAALTSGVIALDRRPGNRIGWLMVGMAVTWVVPPYSAWNIAPLTVLVLFLNSLFFAFAAHLVLAYPSGRLETAYERVVVTLFYVGFGWHQLAVLAFADFDTWLVIGYVQRGVLTAAFVVAVALRFARSSRIERRELLPMWIGALLLAAIEVIGIWDDNSWQGVWRVLYEVRSLLLIALPCVFLYGLLTTPTVASAVGSLVLRLRDGVPPGELAPLLSRTLDDPSLRVLFAVDGSDKWVSTDGERTTDLHALEDRNHAVSLLERDGHPYAAMVHDRAVRETLVHGVASAAAIWLENERLHVELRAQLAEVRASRARIVAAGDRERRRVERDLHDGAQQRLLAASMAMRTARRYTDAQSEAALDAAEAELRLAITELRELARGIHPAVLSDMGLEAAVQSLAARATVPVQVDFEDVDRLARPIESTAYFAISECLANVAKHSGATHADVIARTTPAGLHLEVRDDGSGGARPTEGSGLNGLVDRVAACNGQLSVISPIGSGTTVTIDLPVEVDP